jgi:hypothetical protein
MSNWKRWPNDPLNSKFADIERPDRIVYPDLRDGSDLILASDYSGEHAHPEFLVLAFLLTPISSLMMAWEPARLAVRKKYLPDGRRMSFKALNEPLRINALPSFLRAASQLNGVLVCIAVEKSYSLSTGFLEPLRHDWAAGPREKLHEICFFGAVVVNGLRGSGQNVHWITDDDAIVSTEKAQADAVNLMGSILHKHPDEALEVALGIASKFIDDDRRAEDIVAIADLAAGAYSETLTAIGKSNMPISASGPSDTAASLQVKSALINSWRADTGKPLKHMNAVIRNAEGGQTRVSFGAPFTRMQCAGELSEESKTLDSKWRRALEADLSSRGIDPDEVLKSLDVDV